LNIGRVQRDIRGLIKLGMQGVTLGEYLLHDTFTEFNALSPNGNKIPENDPESGK